MDSTGAFNRSSGQSDFDIASSVELDLAAEGFDWEAAYGRSANPQVFDDLAIFATARNRVFGWTEIRQGAIVVAMAIGGWAAVYATGAFAAL